MVMACGVEVAVIGGGGTLVGWTFGSGVALATTKEGSPPGVVVAACACGISKDPPPLMNNRSAAAVAAPIDPALTFNPNRFVVVVLIPSKSGNKPPNQAIDAIEIEIPADSKQN